MTVDQPISIPPNTTTTAKRAYVSYTRMHGDTSQTPMPKTFWTAWPTTLTSTFLTTIRKYPTSRRQAIPYPPAPCTHKATHTSPVSTPQMPLRDIDHTWDNTHASVYTLLEDGLTVYQAVTSLCICGPTTSATPAAYARTYAITMPSYIPTGTQAQNLNRTHAMAKFH